MLYGGMRIFSATYVHIVAIHVGMLQSSHRLCQLASTTSTLTELSMLISTEHVALTHDCLGLTGWILELCSHYLPIHKIHCAFPIAERTFILKLLMPVINGLPSWCFNSKMCRTSNIYFTVYSRKTAEVGCLWLYAVKYIFDWTFVTCLLQSWSLQSAGYWMSFVVCHTFSMSFWMAKAWNIKYKL